MLLEINFTLVLFAFSFLIFIYLLNLTLYKPVGKVIEKRKGLIDGEYAKSKEYTEDANNMLDGYKNQMKSARHEAQTIIQEGINQAQKIKDEKISQLASSLTKEKEDALKQIKEEKNKAMKSLEGEIKTLTNLITSKVLGMEEKTLVSSH